MGKIPDVIGLPLETACELLRHLGYEVEYIFALPVKAAALGRARAVRFARVSNHKVVLTAVFELNREEVEKGGIQDN